MDIDQMNDKLRELLTKKRYEHSLGVAEMAKKLAHCYGADSNRALVAGLLHDCAKCLTEEDKTKLCNKYSLGDIYLKYGDVMHGPLGACLARDIFEITDEQILNAIKYHTTGREGMNVLEKIIYLADYIEPSRNFPGVDELRNIADQNLDGAVLKALDNTIIYVIESECLLHPLTIEARNDMLISRTKG
ncbi:MAG: bis(5'-nucleosyl)-tetraphosphatase (symmetrical) YqeK [Xylanivirga thermophila]|jgi:predicted HD superfamily hydrolase involved in NAD metabolism|uniref:bis(5'-nucleosyl)-tetraphosphatase (symmetrical) YqeK n=1 Tax=Xylanivirga thermophila TaxID=2496273 RepID=UPI00101BA010|nr:bis(5'-nucleosyl)-tetraphosphatase (symmetrical) YqeK [Xylanivirga thermophila]